MNYKDEIIQYCGGFVPYIGKMDQSEHPNGKNWVRILDPCTYEAVEKDGKVYPIMNRLWGLNKLYRHYIDIRVPDDSIVEIRTLDKNGDLYKLYQGVINRAETSIIINPSFADVQNVKAAQ